jgi:SAM-dependent methyltransferase
MNLTQEVLNHGTWSKPAVMHQLSGGAAFTDPGERAAMELVRGQVRGKPILDLGVGTGRTIPMWRPLTTDYRALDYSAAMVAMCRSKYPGVKVDLCDARDLGAYPAGHFGLVTFAFSGIDAVPAQDRRAVLRSVYRVLQPGGLFFFSSLNIDGPSYRERPWRIRIWPTRNPLRAAMSVAKQAAGMPIDLGNWLRIRKSSEEGPGYAVAPLSAHHYGVLAHYTTLTRELNELEEERFAPGAVVFESRYGRRVAPGDDTSRSDWFHFVARKG